MSKFIEKAGFLFDTLGKLRGVKNAVTGVDELGIGSVPLSVGADITITARNAHLYDGRVLDFTTAAVVTLSTGLPEGFGFAIIPPASGNASIASDSTVLLNGATTTLTRAAASNAICAVVQRASSVDSYVMNGS